MSQKKLLPLFIACLLVIGFLNIHPVEGQSFQAQYLSYLSEVRKGKEADFPSSLLSDEKQIPYLLPVIEQNLADTTPAVRMACYNTLHLVQQKAQDLNTKKTILKTQIRGLQDEFPDICGFTIDNISRLPSSLFDDHQKLLLAGLIERPVPNKPVLMKMAGALNIVQSVPALQRLALPGNPSEIRWAAFMALSRMGDEDAISYTHHRLRNLNSHMVVTLLPSVIYTRQKQLYDYLVELLYSNSKNCGPKEVDQAEPVNCAYEILEELAPAIEGFPIGTTPTGDLDIQDYDSALVKAREWFTKHPEYRIVATRK